MSEQTSFAGSCATIASTAYWRSCAVTSAALCRVNLGGTRNTPAFAAEAAEAGMFEHYAYVSTAYVCGERGGRTLHLTAGAARSCSVAEIALRARLAGSGITVPAFRSYIDAIVGFCLQSDWGKHSLRAA